MAELISSILPHPRRPIAFVEPQVSVCDCVNLMTEKDIGALVVRDNDALLGIVSERDIVRSCLNKNLSPDQVTAADIVYKEVTVLAVNDTVEKAMEVITQTKRRHVLVKDKDELVAIISIGDVLFHLLEGKSRVIEHLENYIHM